MTRRAVRERWRCWLEDAVLASRLKFNPSHYDGERPMPDNASGAHGLWQIRTPRKCGKPSEVIGKPRLGDTFEGE